MHAMSTTSPLTLLPIDECEEWIWDILDSTRDCGFEYIADQHKDFLIFNTNDFHADTKALYKIRKITGMTLIQISTHNGNSQLWFYRSRLPSIHNEVSWYFRSSYIKNDNRTFKEGRECSY